MGTALAVCSNAFPGTSWSTYRAGPLPRRQMSARVPTPPLQRAQKGGLPASRLAPVCLPQETPANSLRSVPSRPQRTVPGKLRGRAGSGFGKQLPLLFSRPCGRSEGGAGSAGSRSPGRARRRGMGPSPAGCLPPQVRRPHALSPRRTRSRPSVRMLAAARLLRAPPPSRRPQLVQEHPESQGARMWATGDGHLRRDPGRCQGEGAGLCVSCSPAKQH